MSFKLYNIFILLHCFQGFYRFPIFVALTFTDGARFRSCVLECLFGEPLSSSSHSHLYQTDKTPSLKVMISLSNGFAHIMALREKLNDDALSY